MAVDDTGGGGEQGGNATQRRFEPLRLSRREPLQIIDAVRPGRVGNAFKTRDFAFFSGYDRLANLDMRDSMIAAIGVKALAPGDAAACFQAAGRIIKPAMNHLAVARRGLEPDRIGSTSCPANARARAVASPTTPAPITTHSISFASPLPNW